MRNRLTALAGLVGWRRRILLVGCGILAAAALPPVYFLPGFFVGAALLAWLVATAPRTRTAFADGWWFGVGHGIIAYYWIGHAFLVDVSRHGWMIPFAIGGLAAGLALFPALAALVARAVAVTPERRVLAFMASFALIDWGRGHILTGFPWNLPATIWSFSDWTIQPAAWVGVWGLGLATYIGVFGLVWLASAERGWRLAGWVAPCLLWVLLGAGAVRLINAPPPVLDADAGEWRVRIVQPNLDQALKWRPDLRISHFQDLLRLSVSEPVQPDQRTLIVWPETATPFLLAEDGSALAAIGRALRPGDILVTGTPLRRVDEAGRMTLHNSVIAVDSSARIVAEYDKAHLVPFGEYMPLKDWLPFGKLTAGKTDFTPGPGPATVRAAEMPSFSPLICYEVIFPSAAVDGADRPDWLLNVTNDGWFGISSGPHQHFAAARFRAVEQHLPLLRVANTGISAYIDGYGRITAKIALGEQGIVDSPLSSRSDYSSVYVWIGDKPFFILAICMFMLAALPVMRRKRGSQPT